MALGLRVEDRLDGQVNFGAWKERIKCIFEEAEVWDIVEQAVVIPTDPKDLAEFRKKNARAKRLIMDGIKDHVIPHVRGKDYAFQMWTALTGLYQSSNENRTMVLKEKLKAIKMANSKSVVTYLTKLSSIRDELAAIGETIASTELAKIALNGLPKSWEVFVDGIIARENFPGWERLWDDCVQNEIRKSHGGEAKHDEENENVALATKGKKGKIKKSASSSGGKGKGKQQKEGKEKDYSKVKC